MVRDRVFAGIATKLIVSVSVGYSALFRWKLRSTPDCDADSCWLHHGDLLVMDGRCHDEYLHTVPRLDGERVNITYRWLKNHSPHCPLSTGGNVLLARMRYGFIRLSVRGTERVGVGHGRVPVDLTWVGDCAFGLPRPGGTSATEMRGVTGNIRNPC